jgi:hypothetical protein
MRISTRLALARIAAIYYVNTGVDTSQNSALAGAAMEQHLSGGPTTLDALGILATNAGGEDSPFYKAMAAFLGPFYLYLWNQAYQNILDITCSQGKARLIQEMVLVSIPEWDNNLELQALAASAMDAGETVIGADTPAALGYKGEMEKNVAAHLSKLVFGQQGSPIGLRLMPSYFLAYAHKLSGTTSLLGKDLTGASIINGPEEPSKDRPHLGSIAIMDPGISYGAQGTGLSSVFMNHIPAIEMSRAGVYFSLGINIPGPPAEPASGRMQTLSQMRFLSPEGTLIPNLAATADDHMLYAAPPGSPGDTEDVESYVGMELFTSPQTLVNYDSPVDGQGGGALDKSRPFMSLISFKVQVIPSRGAMSTQTASLQITLHDRSRLHEISELVMPQFLGKLELSIEWGWAHPDPWTNDFGALLNSLRTAQKFSVYQSSYQFTDSGQVEITLSLISKGASQANFTDAAMSANVREKWVAVESAMAAVKLARGKVLGMHGIKAAVGTSEISTLSLSSTGHLITGDASANIDAWIKKFGKGEGDTGELATLLTTLKSTVSSATATLNGELAQKWKSINAGFNADPFMTIFNGAGNIVRVLNEETAAPWRKQVSRRDYKGEVCSFGKIANLFMGLPLAQSGLYDEVQTVFYCANDDAGWFAGGNLGSLPIDLRAVGGKTMEDLLKIEYQKYGGQYPVARIMKWIVENYIESQYSLCYGLSANTSPGSGGASNFKLKDGKIVALDPGSKIASIQANNETELRKAYYGDANQKTTSGGAAATPFRPINLKIHLEVVQGDESLTELITPGFGEEDGVSDTSKNAGSRTVLRIHFIDAGASNSTVLDNVLRSFKDTESGIIDVSAPQRRWAGMNQDVFKETIARRDSRATAIYKEMTDMGIISPQHMLTTPLDSATAAYAEANELIADCEAAIADGQDPNSFEPELTQQREIVDAGPEILGAGYTLNGDADALMKWIQTKIPYIKYGSEGTNIKQISAQTNSDSKTASMYMVRQATQRTEPGPIEKGLPMQHMPLQLSIDMMGNPLIEYMQQYFVNLGTRTSLDNRYCCIGLSHDISPGQYSTSAQFVPLDAYATFRSTARKLDKAALVVSIPEPASSP